MLLFFHWSVNKGTAASTDFLWRVELCGTTYSTICPLSALFSPFSESHFQSAPWMCNRIIKDFHWAKIGRKLVENTHYLNISLNCREIFLSCKHTTYISHFHTFDCKVFQMHKNIREAVLLWNINVMLSFASYRCIFATLSSKSISKINFCTRNSVWVIVSVNDRWRVGGRNWVFSQTLSALDTFHRYNEWKVFIYFKRFCITASQ
jgi:hypothetical protein